jgi:hypothetical protein
MVEGSVLAAVYDLFSGQQQQQSSKRILENMKYV